MLAVVPSEALLVTTSVGSVCWYRCRGQHPGSSACLQWSEGNHRWSQHQLGVCCGTGAADNTRVALHFANAAKRVTMQPHVNEVVNQKALLRKLRDEVALLRKQLVRTA